MGRDPACVAKCMINVPWKIPPCIKKCPGKKPPPERVDPPVRQVYTLPPRVNIIPQSPAPTPQQPSNGLFGTPVEAGKAAILKINSRSISEDREYCGIIIRIGNGQYTFSDPHRGGQRSCLDAMGIITTIGKAVGYYHTHGGDNGNNENENFSPADYVFANAGFLKGYFYFFLGTPCGAVKQYKHLKGTITHVNANPQCLAKYK